MSGLLFCDVEFLFPQLRLFFRTQVLRIEPTCRLLFAIMHYVSTNDTAHNRSCAAVARCKSQP